MNFMHLEKYKKALFCNGFSYEDITEANYQTLKSLLEMTINQFNKTKKGSSMQLKLSNPFPTLKEMEDYSIELKDFKGILLDVDGSYFEGRQAIHIHENGYVSVGNWCDEEVIVPFEEAFNKWTENVHLHKQLDSSNYSVEEKAEILGNEFIRLYLGKGYRIAKSNEENEMGE